MAEFVGASTNVVDPVGEVASVTVNVPDGVLPGDTMLLFITTAKVLDEGAVITPPAGWDLVAADTVGAPWYRAAVYQRTAGAGEAGQPVTTLFNNTHYGGVTLRAYRGFDPAVGSWVTRTTPVDMGPGSLFLAFVWAAGISSVIEDPAGDFATVEHRNMFGPVYMTWGVVTGTAGRDLTSVTIDAFDASTGGGLNARVLAFVGEAVPEPARIRSHVSEDAGSLFQATQAVAVESAVSEAFPYGTALEAGRLKPFREALAPDDIALVYYPIPTRNQEMLVTVEGETNLGRMARTYPGPIVTRVADIPGHSGDTMTAQQAIQHVFDRWASEFPWFQPLPVPDLRLLVGEAVADPRQYYIDNPDAGVLTTEAIVIPQDGDNRRTMREIVDEWLSIFPGTIVRQNAAGSIELVPRVGPDAPDEVLTLEWRDILSMSDGEDDPRGVVNVGRTTSQGWEWRDDEAVVPPLYVLATRSDGLTPAAMQEVTDGLTAEPLANGGEREFEVFVEPDTPLDVDVTFSAWSASNPAGTGGLTEEVTLPLSFTVALGQTRTLEFSWFIFGVDNEKTLVYVTRTERGLKVRVVGDRYRFGPNPFAGTRYVAYLLEVTATGTAWTRSNEAVTAEFSLANGDVVPGPDGSNALATSTALYGEREATIRSDVFQLTPEQAQAVAQGFVLFNINPRTVRDVQQSEWNAYPVKFDHIGRLVDLPNGERAVVENRSYSDSFAPNGGFMQSTFTATVQELVIDTSTEYLYLDSGDYMRLDDGTLVEAS